MADIIEGKLFLMITSISTGATIFTSFIRWPTPDWRHFLLEMQNDWLDSILQRISAFLHETYVHFDALNI